MMCASRPMRIGKTKRFLLFVLTFVCLRAAVAVCFPATHSPDEQASPSDDLRAFGRKGIAGRSSPDPNFLPFNPGIDPYRQCRP
jgi:hypothetical protein